MKNIISLNELPIGSKGKVVSLNARGNIRRRLLDLGIITNTIISALFKSPYNDPIAYEIRGAVIALRTEESKLILLEID